MLDIDYYHYCYYYSYTRPALFYSLRPLHSTPLFFPRLFCAVLSYYDLFYSILSYPYTPFTSYAILSYLSIFFFLLHSIVFYSSLHSTQFYSFLVCFIQHTNFSIFFHFFHLLTLRFPPNNKSKSEGTRNLKFFDSMILWNIIV